MAVITISRTLGSGGDEIARDLCHELRYQLFDKRLVKQAASEAGVSGKEIVELSEDTYETRTFIERLFGRSTAMPYMGVWPEDLSALYAMDLQALNEEDLLQFTQEAVLLAYYIDNMVIVGRGSQIILKDHANVLHVRIDAPYENRTARVIDQIRQSEAEVTPRLERTLEHRARDLIRERDAASSEYIKRFYHANWADPNLYHMVLNSGSLSITQANQLIIGMLPAIPGFEKDSLPVEQRSMPE